MAADKKQKTDTDSERQKRAAAAEKRQRKEERRAGFRTLVIILLLLLLVAVWWDRNKNHDITGPVPPAAAGQAERPGADRTVTTDTDTGTGTAPGLPGKIKAPPEGWIKRAYFSFPKGKTGPSLKINVETKIPTQENQYFSYIYWKNGKPMGKKKGDTLEPTSYKKGDVIFADVLLQQDGQELERKRSEMVQVFNTAPVIKDVAIPEIIGPGTYTIKVNAEDIDKDKITFSLVNVPGSNPLPAGSEMQIDPGTGVVTCTLGEDPPPGKLNFIIAVNDGDGGTAKKEVTIPFKIYKTPGKNKNKKKKETGSKGEPR